MLGAPLRLLWNLLALLVALPLNGLRLIRRTPPWLAIDLEGQILERARPSAWFRFGRSAPVASLDRLGEDLDAALANRRVEGVLVTLRDLRGGWARLAALRALLGRVRAKGKTLVVHLSSPRLQEYFVATSANRIVMDESGPLWLTGLVAEGTFYGEALGRIGVVMEIVRREEYKTAPEAWTRHDMSPAQREATERILDLVGERIASAVAEGRQLDAGAARALLEGGPHSPEQALARGAVDEVAYLDRLRRSLVRPRKGRAGGGATAVTAEPEAGPHGAEEPSDRRPKGAVGPLASWARARVRWPRWRPLVRSPGIVALLPLHGIIVPGEGGTNVSLGALCGAAPACRALDDLAKDRRVRALVLHVDSRGGAANASDLIWHAASSLGAKKPLIACFGDVAASGGYYVAAGARRIVAGELTLTGSIGVFAGKVVLAGLYERLGIGKVLVARGPAAGLLSTSRPLGDEERRRLEADVEARYQQFLDRVARGRRLPLDEARAVAKGRVWLGSDALERRLVDQLGSLADAVEIARGLARRRPREQIDVRDVPLRRRGRGLVQRLFANAAQEALRGPLETLAALLPLAALAGEPVWALDLEQTIRGC